jgi:hypothetical protein
MFFSSLKKNLFQPMSSTIDTYIGTKPLWINPREHSFSKNTFNKSRVKKMGNSIQWETKYYER